MAFTNVFPESNDVSMIAALGPFKMEVRVLTSDGTNDDTFASKLQNPIAVTVAIANTDLAAGGASGVSATVTGKTVTVTDAVNTESYTFFIFGN